MSTITEIYADIEIMIDDEGTNYRRIYIIDGWQSETYNGTKHKVPNFSKELTEDEYKRIKYNYLRNKKLSRILN